MKNLIWPLAVSAVFGTSVVSAAVAEKVQVTLDLKPTDAKVERVSTPDLGLMGGKGTKAKAGDESHTWYMVRVPLKVEGKNKNADEPVTFVDSLKVRVYLVFTGESKGEMMLVDKEITYVEIPLTASSGDKASEGRMNAVVFISPGNAAKICGTKGKVDPTGHLGAVAVEATFGGSNCLNTKVEPCVVVDRGLKSKLTGSWWKKKNGNKKGVALSAISETPFAPFYASLSPATSPMYAMGETAKSSSGSGSSSATTTDDSDSDTTSDKKGSKGDE